MVSTGYHDAGEEWVQKVAFRQDLVTSRDSNIKLLLFNDSSDQLSDSSDISDISTEPTGSNYSRTTTSLDGSDVSLSVNSGDLRAQATGTFDTSDSTQTIDAWAAVVNFKSDIVNAEGSENDHLLCSATLSGGSVDLSSGNDSVDLTANIDQG